ncbi:hypothetical protein EVA_16967 [gut metagenome]|uniref:Uncharacterized protein n=1 Tax=gut metagenome TaxID=749906 RepID=J9FJ34_9ZZZZ
MDEFVFTLCLVVFHSYISTEVYFLGIFRTAELKRIAFF